jgi:diadenosine tetraphosphate (Ap4A) HIT family hydrolase
MPATQPKTCAFCKLPDERIVLRNDHGLVIRDAYPVSPGHSLVIPSRHVVSFFELTLEERLALLSLLDDARRLIDGQFKPGGYNIGINDGPLAGQTIGHMHLHLIPRYPGDQRDPRGGVRWIFPDKADYWTARDQAAGS